MNTHDREVVNEFVAAIRRETSVDRLTHCYRPDNLACVDESVKRAINEEKRKRIEEL